MNTIQITSYVHSLWVKFDLTKVSSRALIWTSLELCQDESQTEAPTRGNNIAEYNESFPFCLVVLICSNSIFNLLKRLTDGNFFYFYAKR